MGSNFRLCVIVSRDSAFLGNVGTILETVLPKKKKMRKEEREKKKADKLLKCSTVECG